MLPIVRQRLIFTLGKGEAMTNPNTGSGSGVSGHAFFVVMLAAVGGVGYFGSVGDYVTAVVISVTAIGALLGFWKGALGFLALGAAMAGGYYFARPVDQLVGPCLGAVIGDRSWLSPAIQLGLSGVIAGALTQLIVLVVGRSILSRNEVLSDFNRTVGIGLGSVQSFAAAAFLLCGLLVIEPLVQPAGQQAAGSQSQVVAGTVASLAERTRKSALHPLLVQYDPFQRFPQLKQSLQNFSQPSAPTNAVPNHGPGSSMQNSLVGWLANNSGPNNATNVPPPTGPLNANSLQDLVQRFRSPPEQPGLHP